MFKLKFNIRQSLVLHSNVQGFMAKALQCGAIYNERPRAVLIKGDG